MPCNYVALNGATKTLDLDSVFDVALGYSAKRSEWTATLIFDPESGAFVELRSSPQDFRGNSSEEAEEVDGQYIFKAFGLDQNQLSSVIERPADWGLVNLK